MALVQITFQNVIYNFDANLDQLDGWSNVLSFQSCGVSYYFLGSYLDTSVISRLILNLESHYVIKIEGYFLRINENDEFSFFLDGYQLEQLLIHDEEASSDCGSIWISNISIIHQHNRRTGLIQIGQPQGGIIKLQISILNCQEECIGCIWNYPINCAKWMLHQYSFNYKQMTSSEGWDDILNYHQDSSRCDGCQYLKFKDISYSTQIPFHQDILIRFYKGSLNSLILNYMYEKVWILGGEQVVEIFIVNYPNEILNLNIKSEDINEESWIRDFEIYYTMPELQILGLNQGCQDLIGDQCLNCQDGWILDEFQQSCSPICGDMIIKGYEECDDGNLISYDGCFQCKHQCIDSCKTCILGICKQCLEGFVLNSNNYCDPQCGDGIVIPYSIEQCDIKDDEDQSGCKDCKYTNCKQSFLSNCLECEEGFIFLVDQCYPYCDNINFLEQLENCEDGDLQSFQDCIEDGQNVDRDMNQLIIVVIQFVEIRLSLQKKNVMMAMQLYLMVVLIVFILVQKIVVIVIKVFVQSVKVTIICIVICGDGLVQEQEECDDGNDQVGDGCLKCEIEQNWVCNSIMKDSYSQCIFVKAPHLIINYLNMTQNKQQLTLEKQPLNQIRCRLICDIWRVCFRDRSALTT
ncbi:unnamed protein product [Paramecium octaurelia]|uniref:Uncharacterized protein n=1 Tax=Paramecium octaurelia TaxID=43137 RepID=A0A8S1T275_PAROT|nr:unnamed protein product [Paramecium octaurelia]